MGDASISLFACVTRWTLDWEGVKIRSLRSKASMFYNKLCGCARREASLTSSGGRGETPSNLPLDSTTS